jgi:viroplasmin and RNaseH domain-containing protein
MPTKFYAVAIGHKAGIYMSWEECKLQVHKFKGAIYKSFKTKDEAKAFLAIHQPMKHEDIVHVQERVNRSIYPASRIIENNSYQ